MNKSQFGFLKLVKVRWEGSGFWVVYFKKFISKICSWSELKVIEVRHSKSMGHGKLTPVVGTYLVLGGGGNLRLG